MRLAGSVPGTVPGLSHAALLLAPSSQLTSPHCLRWVRSRPDSLHLVPLGAMNEEAWGCLSSPLAKGLPPTLLRPVNYNSDLSAL